MKTIEDHKRDWRETNTPLGRALGYPECCIKEFCAQPPIVLKNKKPTKDDRRRYKAGCIDGVFSGFIPCAFHARKITMGKITLQSLIFGRDPSFPPFPHEKGLAQ